MTRTSQQRRWATALESSTFGVWDLDPGLEVVHYSPQWKARLGFPRIGAPDSSAFWRCRVHPEDVDPMLRSIRAHLDGSSSTYEMQFRLRSNGSGYRTMLSRGRVVSRDDVGNATRMIGTMIDLTGSPVSAANYGLALERPEPTLELPVIPFHTALCALRPANESRALKTGSPDARTSRAVQEGSRLIDLIDDLLDIALRDATGAQ